MTSLTYPAPIPRGRPTQPVPAVSYSAGPLDLNCFLIDGVACTFIYDVGGWSMRLAGINDGDKVVVERSVAPHTGDIVVAIVNDEFTIKRMFWTGTAFELHPDNPVYEPIRLKDGAVLQVFGVVVGVVRKVRR